MIEFTLDFNGQRIRKRGPLLILAGTWLVAAAIGGAVTLLALAADKGPHLILTERDCYIQHSFVADGVRYYCAPWIEVAP
ncbi:MAG: hypothetical protein ACK5PF_08870 [bacterium]